MQRLGLFGVLLVSAALAGCTGSLITPDNQETKSMVGPAPRLNSTPMASALACIRQVRGRGDLRIGVSDLVDGTGVMEGLSQNSRALSQRPDMMMVVALAAAGASLVNRSSVNVAEWELNKAMEKKLGDGRSALIENERVNFRPVRAGTLLGSTHYVTGAITELNWNIASGVAEAGAYSAALGRRTYRISIAVDIVVTNTQTTEIVHARSYKKQLVGMETNANFFRFFARDSVLGQIAQGNGTTKAITDAMELFNANLGEKQNEPTQTALRWVIELAAYDIMRSLRRGGGQCDELLPPDSLEGSSGPGAVATAAPPPVYVAPVSARAEAEPAPPPTARAVAERNVVAPVPVRTAEREPAPPPPAAPAPAPTPKREAAQPRPSPVAQRQPAQISAASYGAKVLPEEAPVARPTSVATAETENKAPPQATGPRLMSGAAPALTPTFSSTN